MITLHSIDLKTINEPCFAAIGGSRRIGCRLLRKVDENCGTYKCPFYKPAECRNWVRIEDRLGISIVPSEEYFKHRRKQYEYGTDLRK